MVAQFLSTEGTVYAWGNDIKKRGIMGLGNNFRQQRPYPNSHLFDYMIRNIDVCDSHACAVDTNGRLFVWGSGTNGELGLDNSP
jgi:alpha-tubulin suppressor-like RCC1 family protein